MAEEFGKRKAIFESLRDEGIMSEEEYAEQMEKLKDQLLGAPLVSVPSAAPSPASVRADCRKPVIVDGVDEFPSYGGEGGIKDYICNMCERDETAYK